MSTITLMTAKLIGTKTRSISARSKSLREDIQEVAIQVSAHAFLHGDVTLANNLLTAATGCNKLALIGWLSAHGPFIHDKTTDKCKLNKAKRELVVTNTQEEILSSFEEVENWWEFAGEPKESRALDVLARINALTKTVETAKKEGREVKGTDEEDIKAAIVTLLASLSK